MKIAKLDGCELAYLDIGDGEPLLLIHGFPLDHTMWLGQLHELSRRYRVIAPDLRGFGRSVTDDPTSTMKSYADELAELLASLDLPSATICGLSMGGYIAFQFWEHHARRVDRMIICDSRADADSKEVARGRRMMAERVMNDGTEFVADALIPKLFAPVAVVDNASFVDVTARVIRSTRPPTVAAAQRAMAAREDYSEKAASIDCPTLLICGEHDVITPPAVMKDMATVIPNSELVVIADAGHMAPLERPAVANDAILNFLGR